jgi:hypothetical protein
MRLARLIGTVVLVTSVALAQQANSNLSRMTIDGVDGPPYPIEVNVRTNTISYFQMQGITTAVFSIVASGNGALETGAATFFGDSFDLPISPPFVVCLDGIANPALAIDANGQFSFPVPVPPPGNPPTGIPLNFKAAYQAAVVDFFSPFGWSLTAATRATVIQGPTIVNIQTGIGGFGSSGVSTVNLAPHGVTLPYYGVNYTTVHISGDGYMTFGGSQVADFTPSASEMNATPPRIAGFWCDMDQQGTGDIIRYTIDPTPPGAAPFLLVEFINVGDAVNGFNHSVSWKIDSQGFVQLFQLPTNNASVYDMIVGISSGANPQIGQKDLSAIVLAGGTTGAVNECFYEWFGIVTQNIYYAQVYNVDRLYDLYALTLNFLPSGVGSLPGSTNRYTLY